MKVTTKLDTVWPLMVVNPPKAKTLEKELASGFPAQNQKDTVTLGKVIERRVDGPPEKGTFVDLYI
jgi:hypothetical protein